ncbi:uncharacterized protein LOC129568249 isoform X2 [Sitodiplosis mosellana]|nr:uncharacterized protein LOC129568249 isoform X2 [Sitodiplosis mosellana]XP_055301891.1 uncharacterized protein LOC129568249 isoform X2 [Sitodiplosis mosellana]XP_055301892.1 uncharacterized protein LOC129568249 isoform X2 [Sitodiplosis mosellana]XP_055301893.1 uncharacterized protein LOC129568249 isoform X2 [Sitodiplosis mosellana]
MDGDINRSGPSSKRRKSNNEDNKQEAVEIAVAVRNAEPLPDIFKLNVDCLEEIFDYLSLTDLSAVAQTCKKMQKIAGYCFQQSYGAAKGSIEMNDSIFVNTVKVNCFMGFMQKVSIDDDHLSDEEEVADSEDIDMLDRIEYNKPQDFIGFLGQFDSLKEIEIGYVNLTMSRIESMKNILNKVDCLTIDDCEYEGQLLDSILASCSNLKYLCMDGSALIGNDRLQWLHRHYPRLKGIELLPVVKDQVMELKTFFLLNAGIQKLAIGDETLWLNRQLITDIELKLDVLAIEHNKSCNLDLFRQLLNELYERGFYKRLHYYCPSGLQQEIIDKLASMNSLMKLRAKSDSQHFTLSALINLEELCISKSCLISDLKSLPLILNNLKMIHFGEASSDDILAFISRAVKVNKIKVLFLLSGAHFDKFTNILDLSALNKAREKLAVASKVTIYVAETVYLATKWVMEKTDYSLIEMKRIDSYDWQHEFTSHYYKYDY